MAEDDGKGERRRKESFLQAYISQRDATQRKAFSSPPDSQQVEMAQRFARPEAKAAPRRAERVPIRELAMQRSRTYLRPDQGSEPAERPVASRTDSSSPYRYRGQTGYKLVKDGVVTRSGRPSRERKRISLYDLYAPRKAEAEEHEGSEGADEAGMPEGEAHGEDAGAEFWRQGTLATEEATEGPVDLEGLAAEGTDGQAEDPDAFRKEAKDILFGPRRKRRGPPSEEPILKEGPEERPHPGHAEKEEEGVMEAGTMVQPEHARTGVEESAIRVGMAREAEEAPVRESMRETGGLEKKTAHGDLCPSCGSRISADNRMVVCSDCSDKGCYTCNRYDLGHQATNVYYDYQFDFPLCIRCYEKAFAIQKQLGKAKMCFGNGNLTYALYYAQNALKLDPESKYAEKALDLINKIDTAKRTRESQDQAWKRESKRITRARWQDPAWK
jgi:hypothetical protein